MTTTTNMVAKIAAVVAGAGLVLASFAPMASAQTNDQAAMEAQIAALMAQIAALQAQTGGSTSASMTFTRDLTIGASGADVTALQNWLIKGGYAIPAGATGYFGAQTAAALAKYQAANAITPAAGYFGPITRAKVNASAGGSTGGNTGGNDDDDDNDDDNDNDGELDGGEASLEDFELRSEEGTLDEAAEEVEIATAEFDVEDGDVRVERVELSFQAASSTLEEDPADFIETLQVWADGDMLGEIDLDDEDVDGDDADDAGEADIYTYTISDLDEYIVSEGERAELTFAVTVSDNIDDDEIDAQEFTVFVMDEGIRAVDGEGIDHYIGDGGATDDGDGGETVEIDFGMEDSGDLRIRTNEDDPEATTLISDEDEVSEEYTVFVFNIENDEDADAEIMDLTIEATLGSTTLPLDELIRDATLMVDGEEYDGDISDATTTAVETIVFDDLDLEIGGDEEVTFELMVRIARDADNTTIDFSVDGDDVDAEGVDSGDDSEVSGSASSERHTIAQDGIMATAEEASNRSSNEADSTLSDTGVGTFRVTFEVEAIEEDAYIYRGAAMGDNDATPFSGVASTTGIVYNVYQGSTASSTAPSSATVQSGADTEGNFYVVREGDTESFTITVTVDTPVSGSYYIELDAIRFDDVNDSSTANDELYSVPDESEFESEALSLY